MKEKRRTEKQSPGGGSIFDGAPAPQQNVTVSSGPYSEDLPVAGMTYGGIRRKFSDRLDIDPKAAIIVNGVERKEDEIAQCGESLMFVRHAGEKGGAHVVMEGPIAKVFDGEKLTEHSMKVEDLLERAGPGLSTSPVILPTGVRTVLSSGQITLWVWEQPPRIHRLGWIAADSPKPYGPCAKYLQVRIALPYLIIVAVFGRSNGGTPFLIQKDECFFRTEPLRSVDDELLYPGLLNCSKWGDVKGMGHPLSWICTQHLKPNPQMKSDRPGDRFQGGFEAVRYCLLETNFNLSSEHHEGNSWYGASKKLDPRIATVEEWEENTKKDPLFVLEIPWIKTGYSVAKLADRIFQQHAGGAGTIKTADDLARLIINQ